MARLPKQRTKAGEHKEPFEVVVGNIGTVYSGNNYMAACSRFQVYVKQSKSNYGRAAGESVTLLQGSEIRKEYIGALTENGEEL